MKQELYLFIVIFVVLLGGCASSQEEKELKRFLRVWSRVKPFYTERVALIAQEGFLNPALSIMLHEDLKTNSAFCEAFSSEFSSFEEYVNTFSNVSLHYTFLSFQENLQGRSSVVLMREIEDVLIKSEGDSSPQAKQKRMMATLLYERLKQYRELEKSVSTNWMKAVLNHARELGSVYAGLVEDMK